MGEGTPGFSPGRVGHSEIEPPDRTEGEPRMICDVCGNDYDKPLEIAYLGGTYVFDSFECAIHALAPVCGHCGCRVVGHGMEADGSVFCCAHCAETAGVEGVADRA